MHPSLSRWCRRTAPGLALLLLAGCNLGPRYARPSQDTPARFRAEQPADASVWPAPDWWRGFRSPQLDALITDATAHNQNIAVAVAQIREADAAVRIAGAPLLPTVGLSGNQSWQRVGSSSGSTSGFTSFTSGLVTGGGSRYVETRSYSLELNASYEIDFWGKNLATYQAAQATAIASRYNAAVVALTAVTSVATTYFEALGTRDQLAVAERNLAAGEEVLRAVQGQLSVGTASLLDVAQQQALVDGLRAEIPSLRNTLDQYVIGLGILTGRPPEQITLEAGSLDTMPAPLVAPGLPSGLLARRPDIAEAEATLIAQNGSVRAARAAFFPTISLTGSGGWTSGALTTLFGPGSTILSAGSSIAQTIFDNGALSGQYQEQRARFDELAADYRQTVLQAFTDVENALTALRYTTDQEALERSAVASAQRALDISRAQLQAGTVNIVTVLNTETTLFGDLSTLEQVRLARFLALVNLYKALGGGWTLPTAGAAS
jgi:outer membrane protein, multidrug efflux system